MIFTITILKESLVIWYRGQCPDDGRVRITWLHVCAVSALCQCRGRPTHTDTGTGSDCFHFYPGLPLRTQERDIHIMSCVFCELLHNIQHMSHCLNCVCISKVANSEIVSKNLGFTSKNIIKDSSKYAFASGLIGYKPSKFHNFWLHMLS